MMFKKGQAAMEFLMTYGWAILVVLIAIGALAYFGVLNPGRFLPSACVLGNQFGCEEFKATASTNTINLIIRNGRGVQTTVSVFALTNQNPSTSCATTTTTLTPLSGTVPDGGTVRADIACTGALPTAGQKFKADVSFNYLDSGAALTKQSAGTITFKTE